MEQCFQYIHCKTRVTHLKRDCSHSHFEAEENLQRKGFSKEGQKGQVKCNLYKEGIRKTHNLTAKLIFRPQMPLVSASQQKQIMCSEQRLSSLQITKDFFNFPNKSLHTKTHSKKKISQSFWLFLSKRPDDGIRLQDVLCNTPHSGFCNDTR